jgi:hypothetical protein
MKRVGRIVIYYTNFIKFCRTRFLEHEERSDECYKANKCDKMAYRTCIKYNVFSILPLKFKKVQNINFFTLLVFGKCLWKEFQKVPSFLRLGFSSTSHGVYSYVVRTTRRLHNLRKKKVFTAQPVFTTR